MRWKKRYRILMAMLLLVSLLAGCGSGQGGDAGEGNANGAGQNVNDQAQAMGRYIEEEYQLPADIINMWAMKRLENGSFLIAGENGDGERCIWDSKDEGRTWEMIGSFPEQILTEMKATIADIEIAPSGNIAVSYIKGENGKVQYGSVLFTPGGESKAFEPKFPSNNAEEHISQFCFTKDNRLIVASSSGNLYIVNQETGDIEQTMETPPGQMKDSFVIGERLLVLTDTEALFYNIAAGTIESKDEILSEQLFERSNGETTFSLNLFAANQDETALFFCNRNGLYRHILEGTVSEQVINGALNSLCNPTILFVDLAALADDSFLVAGLELETPKLYHYYYDAGISAMPEREVKMYALNENSQIRQSIAAFQKNNPDVYINMEVGLSGDTGVTADDAIKTLNTDIMAGKGPDVIILDDISVQSYIEKGVLLDISDVLENVKKKEEIFENIAMTYKKDNALYAIPCGFMVPAIQGKSEDIKNISDLDSLLQAAQSLKSKHADASGILYINDKEMYLKTMFESFAGEWQNKDGSFSEEKLEMALTQIKEIYDMNSHDSEENVSAHTFAQKASLAIKGVSGLLIEKNYLNIGYLRGANDLDEIEAVNATIKDGAYQTFVKDGHCVFVPCTIVGLSSKGNNQKDAKAFIEFLLSKDAQNALFADGFPINKTTFDEEVKHIEEVAQKGIVSYVGISNEDGELVDYEIHPITTEQLQALRTILEQADTPAVTDATLQNTFIEQGLQVLNDSINAQAAAKTIVQKINLYLSE